MDDLTHKAGALAGLVRRDIDEAAGAALLVTIKQRHRRRQRVRHAALALAALALVGLAALLVAQPEREGGDGAFDEVAVTRLSPDAALRTLARSDALHRLALDEGAARFEVTPDRHRVVEVEAGEVRVRVVGTVFTVARRPLGVEVAVERGVVEVVHAGDTQHLTPGQRGWYPQRAAAAPPAEEAPPSHRSEESLSTGEAIEVPDDAAPQEYQPPSSAPTERKVTSRRSEGASWQPLARSGRHAEAWAALQQGGAGAVRDEPGELLLAADAARLSGHPGEAAGWLQRVVEKHGRDGRAPLAAFTLGRLYLQSLGRPADAARAFAQARQLQPGGALVEDALAREAESWQRAGEGARAREAARMYLKLWPEGRRAEAMKRLVP